MISNMYLYKKAFISEAAGVRAFLIVFFMEKKYNDKRKRMDRPNPAVER